MSTYAFAYQPTLILNMSDVKLRQRIEEKSEFQTHGGEK